MTGGCALLYNPKGHPYWDPGAMAQMWQGWPRLAKWPHNGILHPSWYSNGTLMGPYCWATIGGPIEVYYWA